MKRINLKDPRSTRIFLIGEVNDLEEFEKLQEITFTNNGWVKIVYEWKWCGSENENQQDIRTGLETG